MKEKGFAPIVILFLAVTILVSGIIGYSLGQKNAAKSTPNASDNKITQTKLADYQDKLSKLTKFENLGSFSSTDGTKISFKCYTSDKLPDDPKVLKIKQELGNDKRIIDDICFDSDNKTFIVNSYVLREDSKKIEQRVDFDKFTEPDFFTTEFLYQPDVSEAETRYFRLNSWFSNNDIVFSLIQWPNGGSMAGNANSGTAMTYYKSADFRSPAEIDPKLIEYCNWGVAGGTSARYISSCIRFTTAKDSLYLQGKDLP